MKNYISVGITGGIGSGKSYVCRIIQTMGYPVFYSDEEAKIIVDSHPEAVQAIKQLFGDQAYTSKGPLDRAYVASKVFENNALREQLNQIVHPLVRQRFAQWAEESKAPIVFTEAAILFETGSYKQYDHMCLITAPKDLKIQRVMTRSNISAEEVQSRMDVQWTDEKKIPLSDFVINNDETEPLLPQIVSMIEAIK